MRSVVISQELFGTFQPVGPLPTKLIKPDTRYLSPCHVRAVGYRSEYPVKRTTIVTLPCPVTMGSESDKLRIAIIGAGISGLALAAGLCKTSHLEVHVYEAVAEHSGMNKQQLLMQNVS